MSFGQGGGYGGGYPPGYGQQQPFAGVPENRTVGYVEAYGYGPSGGAARVGANGLLLAPETPADKPHEGSQYLKMNPQEEAVYMQLWQRASGGNEKASAKTAGAVLSCAENLSRNQLRMIWDTADHMRKGFLKKEEFYIALRLIALAQRGAEPTVGGLRNFVGIQLIPKMNAPPQAQQRPQQPARSAPSQPAPAAMVGTAGANAAQTTSLWTVLPAQNARYQEMFAASDPADSGYVNGPRAAELFNKSGLPRQLLRQVWNLCDVTADGRLDVHEFKNAVHLIKLLREKRIRPDALPTKLDPSGLNWLRVAGEEASSDASGIHLPPTAREIEFPPKSAASTGEGHAEPESYAQTPAENANNEQLLQAQEAMNGMTLANNQQFQAPQNTAQMAPQDQAQLPMQAVAQNPLQPGLQQQQVQQPPMAQGVQQVVVPQGLQPAMAPPVHDSTTLHLQQQAMQQAMQQPAQQLQQIQDPMQQQQMQMAVQMHPNAQAQVPLQQPMPGMAQPEMVQSIQPLQGAAAAPRRHKKGPAQEQEPLAPPGAAMQGGFSGQMAGQAVQMAAYDQQHFVANQPPPPSMPPDYPTPPPPPPQNDSDDSGDDDFWGAGGAAAAAAPTFDNQNYANYQQQLNQPAPAVQNTAAAGGAPTFNNQNYANYQQQPSQPAPAMQNTAAAGAAPTFNDQNYANYQQQPVQAAPAVQNTFQGTMEASSQQANVNTKASAGGELKRMDSDEFDEWGF
ncbi:hypothetical protein NDN08_000091 [Rhodosorus marinus]|uniref:Calmodulin n=1 Tax=Rhodosorus marinus TaxID=101924 RepID=A0AAV8UJF0_9RHOD|nr:hypothetical protein NDN08_000091 [Rhodosorus marinus]